MEIPFEQVPVGVVFVIPPIRSPVFTGNDWWYKVKTFDGYAGHREGKIKNSILASDTVEVISENLMNSFLLTDL